MTIPEFLELSVGKWYSQRTSHQLANQASSQGNANIIVEQLTADQADVITLCQQHQIDPKLTSGGFRVVTQPIAPWNSSSKTALPSTTTLMVPVVNSDQPLTGQLLWMTNHSKMSPGQFRLDDDQSLTLSISSPSMYLEERIWFASPNLRLRTNVQKNTTGWSLASFCSEIRMAGS